MLDFNRDLTGPEVFPTVLPARVCVCVWPLPIVAVCIKEQAVTSDQEAYHSCFQDLISRARAKLPLGSQFSFFLIGALIRSGGGKKAHCVCPLESLTLLKHRMSVGVPLHVICRIRGE